jgi:tyrosine-protein kinase shark
VEQLVAANKNLVAARNSETGFVPLHFAAKAGNLEIVRFLLNNKAPAMPRTIDGLFPRDFAKREIIEYLDGYRPEITTYRRC